MKNVKIFLCALCDLCGSILLFPFICPVCDRPLIEVDRVLHCSQGHSFDLAREGYVNLLLGHQRPSSLGDTSEMVQARRRFLERGVYEPLSDAINGPVREYVGRRNSTTLVADIGCGEGYYIGRLQAVGSLQVYKFASLQVCKWAGVDVSKTAVRLAARKYPSIKFVVADTWRKLPFPTASVDILLNIFAPRNTAEFGRVTAPNARLLVVIPGQNHLQNLRSDLGLLQIEAEKKQRVITQLADFFTLQATQHLTYTLNLDASALRDLVQMTPNAWHLPPEKQNLLQQMEQVQTEASFEILSFRRLSS